MIWLYNWHHRDQIKDLVRLPKHANVLFLIAHLVPVCYSELTFGFRKHLSVTKVVFTNKSHCIYEYKDHKNDKRRLLLWLKTISQSGLLPQFLIVLNPLPGDRGLNQFFRDFKMKGIK